MRYKTKREFTTRNFSRGIEATKKARKIINKKKYYGVKINIDQYKKQIYNHFYNPTFFDKVFGSKSPITAKANEYLFKVSSTYDELLEKARDILGDAFRKGSKRVVDNSGDTIKLGEPVDETSVDILTSQQTEYYQNLSEAQSKNINKIISDGEANGETNEQISSSIKSSIKKISSKRALRIARTEIVKSHSVAQIQTMKQAGIEEYNYISANDGKVSKICRKNQGPKGRERIYKTALAGTPNNPLPVLNSHPNCRCVPVAYIRK